MSDPETPLASPQPAAAGATTPPLPRDQYVTWVLRLYVELPETPPRASGQDQQQARRLFARGVPCETVETALLLATLRRRLRPSHAPPLPAIRSLAYFQPVIEELLQHPARRGYLDYLRRKVNSLGCPASQRRPLR